MMHSKLLLDADVLCMRNSTVSKMYAKQVDTVGLHAGRGLVIVALKSKVTGNL